MPTTKHRWSGCKVLKPKGWQGARAGMLNISYLAQRVYPAATYGSAFAYLFRRFGETGPFDWHKQLCDYSLTTPDKDIGFWISPTPSHDYVEPGYWISPAIHELLYIDYRNYHGWPLAEPEKGPTYSDRLPPEGTVSHRCHVAIEAGMRDLLRPVYVRDVPINIVGRMTDKEASKYKSVEHAWQEKD